MSNEKPLYRYRVDRESEEGRGYDPIEDSHVHLYRVAIGSPIIRWCERCGKSFLLQQRHDQMQDTVSYTWVAIEEQGE